MIGRLKAKIQSHLQKPRRRAAFQALLERGLPKELETPARFLVDGKISETVAAVQKGIEDRRREIASMGSQRVEVLYSPKPGSAGTEVTPRLRPEHGELMSFTMEKVAATGKPARWGTFLHLLASEVSGKYLELGACAGISSAYLAAAPSCEKLITIEGSSALADLARETAQKVQLGRVEVKTGLFDDVLDELLPTLGEDALALAYIDGHHEKIATLHYLERIEPALRPGAIVILDDVSWSHDMRSMWQQVCQKPIFTHAADFGEVGVLIYDPNASSTPEYWEFQTIVGKRKIGVPWGWRQQ